MGSVGKNSSIVGFDERYLNSGALGSGGVSAEIRRQFAQALRDAGIYGTEEQIDEALRNHRAWKQMEWRRRIYEDDPEYVKEVDFDTYEKATFADANQMVMSFEEFKRGMLSRPQYLQTPGTLSEGFEAYYHGANPSGYGRGKDARIVWDQKYGYSNMIDNHPELQYNSQSNLYRGIRISQQSVKDLTKAFNRGAEIDFRGPSSWTAKESTARSFTEYSLVGQRNTNIAIFEDVTRGRRTAMPFTHGSDHEVLYSGNAKFIIKGITQDDKGVYHVKVEQKHK